MPWVSIFVMQSLPASKLGRTLKSKKKKTVISLKSPKTPTLKRKSCDLPRSSLFKPRTRLYWSTENDHAVIAIADVDFVGSQTGREQPLIQKPPIGDAESCGR